MNYVRQLQLAPLLRKKSFFLLGPRSTGKTTLIRAQLAADVLVIDLLKSDNFLRLSNRPSDLGDMIRASGKEIVVIDEVQKLSSILDEVHRLIEETPTRFLLTGSSARRLRHGQANLLAGRAWQANLFPLVSAEIPQFDLTRYLTVGGLPQVYGSTEPHEELDAYVGTYLREEIQAEGAVRNLARFGRFLTIAALTTGEVLNFTNVARDIGVSPSTVIEHFRILEDTLIGFFVEPWGQSTKRKEVTAAKFYLFDTGVTNTLARLRTLERHSNLYGRAFEQFIAMELRAAIAYQRSPARLAYWRTQDQNEVDFVVGDVCAIEVKATERTSDRDATSLRRLQAEKELPAYFVVSQDPVERLKDGIRFVPYGRFLELLWGGGLLSGKVD
jgi:predicted AAA+ superfamily ATPase